MKQIVDVLKQYYFYDKNIIFEKFGNGNINKTYLIKKGDWFILQEINSNVFKKPSDVIYNIELVDNYLKNNKSDFEMISLIKNLQGEYITVKYGYKDIYYRCYKYINSKDNQNINLSDEIIYEAGRIIGLFLKECNNIDYHKLKITIPSFHNTKLRYQKFLENYNEDKYFRRKLSINECLCIIKNRYIINNIFKYIEDNSLKLRVCHNDTKIENILYDCNNKAKALIDMDTIMPGYLIFDYADGLRSCITDIKEDDANYNSIVINIEYFIAFTKGFLKETKDIITKLEVNLLVDGLELITYECALRFLTDYLDNDKYFKTTYCSHNLIRTKNQLKLLKEIKKNKNYLKKIVIDIYSEIK